MRYHYIVLLVFMCGCRSWFTPAQLVYISHLSPTVDGQFTQKENYIVGDNFTTFSLEGVRVKVEFLDDDALNLLFPEDSVKGKFSTNPYTYGDWIDPLKGYRPKRFTVFRVTVTNDIYAKVLLDPIKAYLLTDQGEKFHAYGIPTFSPNENFEQYYRALRGQSGNEFYRFDLRMGNVRSSAYLEEQLVFKGESYGGLVAFNPLPSEVEQVELVLRDFVLKFDASGQPVESTDIEMDFEQKVVIKTMDNAIE